MSASFLNDLKKGGIHFRFFEPVFRSRHFYFGRRMHHKVIVIDTRYALVGGVNIANKYNDMPGQSAWLDFALFIEGEIARELCVLCWKSWNGYPFQLGLTPCDKKTFSYSIPLENRCEVRMRRNDWVRRKNEISGTYVEMLRTAKKEITILCSYFLPGKFIRKQITNAVKRGVRIKVVTAGISDVVLAKNAERWFYDWLLRNGVELYEYQKNVLHGKIAVCDDLLMTVGSYNINNISAYASIELNIDVRNANFAGETRKMLDEIIAKDCMAITHEHQVKTNNIIKQFIRWLSYQFIRIVFHLFTFYFKREH
jgi:cardiolipin synthase